MLKFALVIIAHAVKSAIISIVFAVERLSEMTVVDLKLNVVRVSDIDFTRLGDAIEGTIAGHDGSLADSTVGCLIVQVHVIGGAKALTSHLED